MPKHPVQPPEWIDAAPILVERTVEIDASPAAVWEFIADHTGWPSWFTAIDSVEVTGAPSGVGGARRVVARRLPLDEEFTAWEPEQHFAFAVVGSRIPFLDSLAESVRLAPTERGCRVVYRQGLQAKRGFGKVLDLVWRQAASSLGEALVNLKAAAESPGNVRTGGGS